VAWDIVNVVATSFISTIATLERAFEGK